MKEKETRQFQAQTKQLLDLMIHSIYTHREIFLRELISNASDALDKLRFASLTEPTLLQDGGEFEIWLKTDKDHRTLTITDNGIGMTYDDVVNHIGTIAQSGSKQFFEKTIKEADAKKLELIGQFGVGFYSAFMVAERVIIITKSALGGSGVRWESTGDGTYVIEEYDKADRGTTIILELRKDPEKNEESGEPSHEESLDQYLDSWHLERLVKKYSDYIRYPVKMTVEKEIYPKDKDGKIIEGATPEKVMETKILNSMKPIWAREKSEVTQEEYKEFYKQTFHDWNEASDIIYTKAEGTIEYTALLFIPSKAPFDLMTPEYEKGLKLFSKNVFIMDSCKELLPDHFKFVKGLVDSPDFSLNISREILQHGKQLSVISRNLEKKIHESILSMQKNKRTEYETWWKEFGTTIKSGIYSDYAKKYEYLRELLVFESTDSGEGKTTLAEYVGRMKEGQDAIYYIAGKDKKILSRMPQMEAIRDKGYEVLFLTDRVDEFMIMNLPEFDGKKLNSVTKTDGKKEESAELKQEEDTQKDLLQAIKENLKDQVTDVRLTDRLKESAVCLVSGNAGVSLNMEQVLSEVDGFKYPKAERILEINPKNPIFSVLKKAWEAKSDDLGDFSQLLLDQALITEGILPEDPVRFGKKLTELMGRL